MNQSQKTRQQQIEHLESMIIEILRKGEMLTYDPSDRHSVATKAVQNLIAQDIIEVFDPNEGVDYAKLVEEQQPEPFQTVEGWYWGKNHLRIKQRRSARIVYLEAYASLRKLAWLSNHRRLLSETDSYDQAIDEENDVLRSLRDEHSAATLSATRSFNDRR